MNKSDLIAKMAERLGGDHTTAVAAVNGVLEEIEGSVARGERVSLTGFGTFDRRERAPRTGRNPRTGEAIRVGASVVPIFRAGTGFKTLLTQADGVSMSPRLAAVDGNVRKAKAEAKANAKDKKSPAAASGSPAGSVMVAGEAAAAGKKKGKKARNQAGEKGSKNARKAPRDKAGKKAAKGLR